MTFLKRLQDMASSNLNSLVDSMENPQKIMELRISEMKEQELKNISQTAKDHLHDTTALETYQRMIEKIEDSENFAKGLEEIASSDDDESKKAAIQIENELAALKAKFKK